MDEEYYSGARDWEGTGEGPTVRGRLVAVRSGQLA